MSRSTRPIRRVGLAERDRLASALGVDVRFAMWWTRRRFEPLAAWLRCRPAQLRRCLLGREVSARAATRILARATTSAA